jgi:hypothetical protein
VKNPTTVTVEVKLVLAPDTVERLREQIEQLVDAKLAAALADEARRNTLSLRQGRESGVPVSEPVFATISVRLAGGTRIVSGRTPYPPAAEFVDYARGCMEHAPDRLLTLGVEGGSNVTFPASGIVDVQLTGVQS